MTSPELVALFADADAERFISRLVERGIERRCLRPMVWKAVREPMRDARLAQDPLATAGTFTSNPVTRFLVMWDHHGSGREDRAPLDVEEAVVASFERAGVARSRVCAVSFVPEFEVVLEPAWERILGELASRRMEAARAPSFDRRDPKRSMKDATAAHRLKADSALYADLASKLPLAKMKEAETLGRIAVTLVHWFGPTG